MTTPDSIVSPHSTSPLDALALVLGSVEAVRNLRALYLLMTTFAMAALLAGLAQRAFVANPGVAVLEIAAAFFVAFYGGNAAGIQLMDEARGVAVRDAADAVRASLRSAHRVLLVVLAIVATAALFGLLLAALMWLARPDVTGRLLGSWLFGLLVPAGVVAVGLALLALGAVVMPLTAPGVWAGAGVATLLLQLCRWTRRRLLKIALLMAAVSLLTAGVGALVSFVVVAGGRVVGEVATRVVGVDVPPAQLMAGLFGYAPVGGVAAAASAHVGAALVGEGIVFALALVLPGVVYLRGTCSVYLAMCRDDESGR